MEESTWCRLHPDDFSKVMDSSLYCDGQPENVLFTRKVSFVCTPGCAQHHVPL